MKKTKIKVSTDLTLTEVTDLQDCITTKQTRLYSALEARNELMKSKKITKSAKESAKKECKEINEQLARLEALDDKLANLHDVLWEMEYDAEEKTADESNTDKS